MHDFCHESRLAKAAAMNSRGKKAEKPAVKDL
jgi:hypothetical protein